jgi:adenylate cyclase 1
LPLFSLCPHPHPHFLFWPSAFFFATDNNNNDNNNNIQPLLFNTLQVRSALGQGGGPGSGSGGNQRRKLSFRNVSNVVVQLLHSIKYSVEVPFSNIAAAPSVHSVNMQQQQQQNPGVNCHNSGGSTAGHKKVSTSQSNYVRLIKTKNVYLFMFPA